MKESWLVVVGLCGLLVAGSAWALIFISNSQGEFVPVDEYIKSEEVKGFRKAAEKGDAEAQFKLGSAYQHVDDKESLKWYRKAAAQGHTGAQRGLGDSYRFGRGVPEDDREAVKWYHKAAAQGNTEAQFSLFEMYALGKGVAQDNQEAAKWLTRAAEQGNEVAQLRLGRHFRVGGVLPKDSQAAANWYRKAAEQGNKGAQHELGEMYEGGEGVPKDEGEAAIWYRKAAEDVKDPIHSGTYPGDSSAQYKLGIMYAEGRGVAQDYQEAVKWFTPAAEHGSTNAQVALGWMYAHGRGVPQDYQIAAKWYHQVAKAELESAVSLRDASYQRLKERELKEAAKWYRRAADLGLAEAQYELGGMYVKGQAVPQDYVQAQLWFILATAQGHEEAQNARDRLSEAMVPVQVAEAQRLARVWRPEVTALEPPAWAKEEKASVPTHSAEVQATGSGFVVSRTGHVLTNNHVAVGCTQVRIPPNGAAQVVATDPSNDLALLNMGQGTTAVASFREGRAVRLGEAVVAMGFPLRGLLANGPNATTGTLSALAGPGNDTRLLQISAPVQPGNSGGPLLDASGQVIGVVVGKLDAIKVAQATGDIPQNVNFAITVASARSFLDAQGLAYPTAVSAQALDTADIVEAAKHFTVVVECWK